MHIVKPDIHFWGSAKRWKKYGYLIDDNSNMMFQHNFSKKMIRKYWKGSYGVFNFEGRKWKYGSDDKSSYQYKRCCIRNKNKKVYGCFYDAVSKMLLWSYVQGAKEINIVGNDGYTFYSKGTLESGKESQNCFGEGLTQGYIYEYNRKLDWDKYKTLRMICKYGMKKHNFNFSIITPTIFEEFYDSFILNIKADSNMQKWIEPSPKEYKNLYFDCLKNRKLEQGQFKKYNS